MAFLNNSVVDVVGGLFQKVVEDHELFNVSENATAIQTIHGPQDTTPMEMKLVYISIFLFLVRFGGFICERINTSPIIGEVIVGAILGPPLLDFVPFPNGLKLAGLLGIQLAVIEAGIATDMKTLKALAPRGFLIAVLGIILPITLAIFAVMAADGTFLQAFAAGAAIAPTSLGVVAKLLKEQNELDTPLGQVISMAAVFDDVLSLILLSFVLQLADPKSTTWNKTQPLVFAVVFIVFAILASSQVPRIVDMLMDKIPSEQRSHFCLGCLFLFALILTWLANLATTSFLLGGYLAGIAFASVGDVVSIVYEKQVKRLMLWLARLFFAATIAFEIPVKKMFSADAIILGLILGAIAVFGKVLCGVGTYPKLIQDGPAVGVAMLGRGEFGFLIAAQAFLANMITESQYASAVWGVLIPTLLTPVLFGPVFRYRERRMIANGTKKAIATTNGKANGDTNGFHKGNDELVQLHVDEAQS